MPRSVFSLLLAALLSVPFAAHACGLVVAQANVTVLVLPGFNEYHARGYAPSARNVELLKSLKDKMPAARLVSFDASKNDKTMMLCRGSYPVYGPNKSPFVSLVEAAINLELAQAGLANAEAPKLLATLDEFDFSSFFSGGKWLLAASIAEEAKTPLSVRLTHEFKVGVSAEQGCADVTRALPGAIEAFLFKLYSEPDFQAMFQERR